MRHTTIEHSFPTTQPRPHATSPGPNSSSSSSSSAASAAHLDLSPILGTDTDVNFFALATSVKEHIDEPLTIKEALGGKHQRQWRESLDREHAALWS